MNIKKHLTNIDLENYRDPKRLSIPMFSKRVDLDECPFEKAPPLFKLDISALHQELNQSNGCSEYVTQSAQNSSARGRMMSYKQERTMMKLSKSLTRSTSKSMLQVPSLNQETIYINTGEHSIPNQTQQYSEAQNNNEDDPDGIVHMRCRSHAQSVSYNNGLGNQQQFLNLSQYLNFNRNQNSEIKGYKNAEQATQHEQIEQQEKKVSDLVGMWQSFKQESLSRSRDSSISHDKGHLRHFSKNININKQRTIISQQSNHKEILINVVDDFSEGEAEKQFLENHDLAEEQNINYVQPTQTFALFSDHRIKDEEEEKMRRSLTLLKSKQNSRKTSKNYLLTPEPQTMFRMFQKKTSDQVKNKQFVENKRMSLQVATPSSPKRKYIDLTDRKMMALQQSFGHVENKKRITQSFQENSQPKSSLPVFSTSLRMSPKVQRKSFRKIDLSGAATPIEEQTFDEANPGDRLSLMINQIKKKMLSVTESLSNETLKLRKTPSKQQVQTSHPTESLLFKKNCTNSELKKKNSINLTTNTRITTETPVKRSKPKTLSEAYCKPPGNKFSEVTTIKPAHNISEATTGVSSKRNSQISTSFQQQNSLLKTQSAKKSTAASSVQKASKNIIKFSYK